MLRAASTTGGPSLYSKGVPPLATATQQGAAVGDGDSHEHGNATDISYVHDAEDARVQARVSSEYISVGQATRLIVAAGYSFCSNYPLNRYVVLHLEDPATVHDHVTAFIKHVGDWLRYRTGYGLRYVWVLESKPALHVNILLHVPADHVDDFHRRLRRWIKEIGLKFRKGLIKSKPIRHSKPGADPTDYLTKGLRGLLRYVLKGVHPDHAARFGVRPEYQGFVAGRRCGRSETLSPEDYAFPTIPVGKNIWIPGPESLRRRVLEYAWGDQRTGEHIPGFHFPIPGKPTDHRIA